MVFLATERRVCSSASFGALQWRRITSSPDTIRSSQLDLVWSQETSTRSARIASLHAGYKWRRKVAATCQSTGILPLREGGEVDFLGGWVEAGGTGFAASVKSAERFFPAQADAFVPTKCVGRKHHARSERERARPAPLGMTSGAT